VPKGSNYIRIILSPLHYILFCSHLVNTLAYQSNSAAKFNNYLGKLNKLEVQNNNKYFRLTSLDPWWWVPYVVPKCR